MYQCFKGCHPHNIAQGAFFGCGKECGDQEPDRRQMERGGPDQCGESKVFLSQGLRAAINLECLITDSPSPSESLPPAV